MKAQVFTIFLLFSFCGLVPSSSEGQPRDIIEGVHYNSVDALQEGLGEEDFTVVNELFWYGCPRCASLAPLTNFWRDGIQGSLRFTRTPVIWNETMQRHARIFFTAEKLSLGDHFHQSVYDQLHSEEANALKKKEDIITLFSEYGVNSMDFQSAWDSSVVEDSIKSAVSLSNTLKLNKIPALLVGDRYIVTQNSGVPDHHEMILTTNLLIKKLRDMK